MGKYNKSRNRGGGRGPRAQPDNRVSFDKLPKSNERLERYYNGLLSKAVGMGAMEEEEMDQFWETMRRELPNSWRFAGSRGHALAVQKQLIERYIPEITTISHFDGSLVTAPQPVPWYPDQLAWWMTTPKNVVRKYEPFKNFQKYLVSETGVGNISRQEVVSMIPPLVLDVRPGMTVLDMCAAPGSKATQLVEMVHSGEEERVRRRLAELRDDNNDTVDGAGDLDINIDLGGDKDDGDFGRATGLLIANDSDYKRSHMLIHQLKRLSSPNLLVTNHDATIYPSIKLPPTKEHPALNRYLKFDRILADVPCSGDGTARKNVNLWKDWNPGNALGLHVTQVRILARAIQMLKLGGRVVCSTCSMNPVENEAVVAAAIKRCGGLKNVNVVESGDLLPELKRKPGLRKWNIIDKSGRVWNSWQEVQESIEQSGPTVATEKLNEDMFSPFDASEPVEIPLERCMRVYAHQQDTGGFFIAILQKISEIKARPQAKKEGPTMLSNLVAEIDAQPVPEDGQSLVPKLNSLDPMAPPGMPIDDNASAAARQNERQPNLVVGDKRPLDAIENAALDADVASKKLKTQGYADETSQQRTEHWPPPPAANLDLVTRPGDLRADSQPRRPNPSFRARNGQQFEEPFKYLPPAHPEIQTAAAFYQLSPDFPLDRFLVRNASADPVKTIYYTSSLIRDILTENEGKGIKFVHGGVKMFMRQDVQREGTCKWRIQSEGMSILEGYVGEDRVVKLYKKETLRTLLVEMFPKVSDGGWETLGEIGERVRDIGMGCCVLRVEPSDQEDGFTERMVMPLWRSLHSLNLMLAKDERSALLLRIFNDTTALINNSKNFPNKKIAVEDVEEAEAEMEMEAVDVENEMEGEAEKEVAPGFHRENGEIHVDVPNTSLEAANQTINDQQMDATIKPGPYGVVVQDNENKVHGDPKTLQIAKGEETGMGESGEGTRGNADGVL